jgi:uncharacterized membrane protein SpoIIM required for sporulation
MTPHPRLVAQRRRIASIRRAVAALAVAAFIALFATIYVQMASGNDPALASTGTANSTNSSQSTTSSSDQQPAAVTTAPS